MFYCNYYHTSFLSYYRSFDFFSYSNYKFIEKYSNSFNKKYIIKIFNINLIKLIWRCKYYYYFSINLIELKKLNKKKSNEV